MDKLNQITESQIKQIKSIIISYGDDLVVDLQPRLVQINGETKWIIKPRGAEKATVTQFVKKEMTELSSKIVPVVRALLSKYERNFILHTAKSIADAESARRWVKDFVHDKSEAYLEDGGFLRNDLSMRMKSMCVDKGYNKINNEISIGILNNENPHAIRGRIREEVFGLKKGKRDKGITAQADMVMRTELSYGERNVDREIMRQDDEKVGVQIHYYGGPCNSNICPSILKSGYNVKYSAGGGITADFYFDTGVPWYPYHPRCHCMRLRFLDKRDLEQRDKRGKIPKKWQEKIFIEEKKIKYGRAA